MKRMFALAPAFFAASLFAAEPLLPMAEMAVEDGNVSFAERTARAVLNTEGLSQAQRADAEDVLLRAALMRKDYAAVEKILTTATAITEQQRRVYEMNLCNARNDFAATLEHYDEKLLPAENVWGVVARRLARDAAFALNDTARAVALCRAIEAAKATTPVEHAENALVWCKHFPQDAEARDALCSVLGEADKGGIFLRCATEAPFLLTTPEDRKRAVNTLSALIALEGLSSTVKTSLATTLAQLADTPKEKEAYARQAIKAARTEDERIQSTALLGAILLATPVRLDEGLKCLDDAVRLNPSSDDAPMFQLRIAEALAKAGRFDEAQAAYERYRSSYDREALRVRVRQGQARVALALAKYDEALACLEEAATLADMETRAAILSEAADAAQRAGRTQKQVELRQAVAQLKPTSSTLLHLARAYEAADKIPEAKQFYGMVRDILSVSPSQLATIQAQTLKLGSPEEVAADIHFAVMRLGGLYVREGKLTEAIAEYTAALQKEKDPVALARLALERGRIFYTLGQLDAARKDFTHAATSKDSEIASEARFFQVLSLYGLGEDDAARAAAETYAKEYADANRIPDIMLWLAKSDFNRGEYGAARERCEDFVRRWETDARVPQVLAIAARSAHYGNEHLRAVELVARLAKEYPQYTALPDARFLQCEALMELARYGEAAEILDAIIRRNPTATWLGEAYLRKGDCLYTTATEDATRYRLAAEAYREALSRLEDNPTLSSMLLYKMGRTLEKQDLRDDAAEQYLRLIYRILANPYDYPESARQWLRKAVAQLRAIEVARGNRTSFETLLQRLAPILH